MYESKYRKFFILDQISIEDIDCRYTDGFLRCRGKEYLLIFIEVLDMMSAIAKFTKINREGLVLPNFSNN